MRFATLALIVVLPVSGVGPSAAQQVPNLTRDPHQVRLELRDVRRLAEALRSPGPAGAGESVDRIAERYFAEASPGLRAYAERYGVTAASLAAAIREHPSRYARLDELADAVAAQEPKLRTAFGRLLKLFPDAGFPPVWFVVGEMGPGGLTREEGVIVAVERFAEAPEDVVPIVLHELAHFQQAMVQGVDAYRRLYGPEQTLLGLAVREGSAELIAELTAGRHINPAAERYGVEHEAELWARFREEMHRREPGDWMFVDPSTEEWPADLGYWIGYRIARSYYDRAPDKRQAIREILAVSDFEAFLEASGYAERMARASAALETAPSEDRGRSAAAPGFFELRRAANEARERGDVGAALELLLKAHRLGPQNPVVRWQLAELLVGAGRKDEAVVHLRALVEGGVSMDLGASEALRALMDEPAIAAIREGMEKNREPLARARVVCTFDAPGLMPEGIDFDRERRRIILGSFSRGQLVSAGLDCAIEELAPAGTLGVVAGIRVDPARDLVWATSNVEEEDGEPRPAVVAVRLDSGKVVGRKELVAYGTPILLNDLAVTADGSVFVTESFGGALLRTCLDCPALEVFLPPGRLPGPNGVTTAGDGRTLYVAHAAGISRVDSATGAEDLLSVPGNAVSVGADGLYWHEGTLIAVQNQPFHDRIVQLVLDEEGGEIFETRILNARSPGAMFHSTGFLLDGRFYFNGVPGDLPAPPGLEGERPVLLAVPLEN